MSDVYLIPKNELMHYGVKGMKWGHRKSSTSGGKSTGYKIGYKLGTMTGKAIVKKQKKRAEHDARIKKTTDHWGVGGVMLGSGVRYARNKRMRTYLANTMNTAANAYISSSKGSYHTKRGVDFVRRAGVGYLSLKEYSDRYNYVRDIYKSASYANQKYRK